MLFSIGCLSLVAASTYSEIRIAFEPELFLTISDSNVGFKAKRDVNVKDLSTRVYLTKDGYIKSHNGRYLCNDVKTDIIKLCTMKPINGRFRKVPKEKYFILTDYQRPKMKLARGVYNPNTSMYYAILGHSINSELGKYHLFIDDYKTAALERFSSK
jgi:hypothetical protein